MNKRVSLTTQAHHILLNYLNTGDITIDATVGNGHDTLFLARQVGKQGFVFGFDVQQQAIISTKSRLQSEDFIDNVELIHACHSTIEHAIPPQYHGIIKAIMFNLGYLPGGDKRIISKTDSTLAAIQQSITLLAPTGIITITAYPGHSGGELETEIIKQWFEQLSPKHYTRQLIYSSEKITAPRLFIIKKHLS
ncbi:MAG: 16S rRNA (cytosine(1402)-N(4))-methyltransferase [Methylococcaceae bacterium]|nr:16S rRNA (cytosine(1402)-N(4))-methyltransferase [Methylococcaceae bacterium]